MQAPFTSTADDSLPFEARALLDSIAPGEASGYNTLYGGRSFSSFGDHPRQDIPITSGPNAGKTSSAAGRYQFLAPTWDEASQALGLSDFSPKSQDQAAWWLAQRDYKKRTGSDLLGDIQQSGGDQEHLNNIGRQLSGTWTSLPSGIERNGATGGFGSRFAQNLLKTGDGSSAPIAMAFAEQKKMADPTQDNGGLLNKLAAGGPGALFGVPNGYIPYTDDAGATKPGYDLGGGLQGAAAWLQSIHDPKAAAALIASLQKPQNEWTTHIDPKTGIAIQSNKAGAVRPVPAAALGLKSEAQADADKKIADKYADTLTTLRDSATRADAGLARLDQADALSKDPATYQGTGHDFVKTLGNTPMIGGLVKDITGKDAAKTANLDVLGAESMAHAREAVGGLNRVTNAELQLELKPQQYGTHQLPETNQQIISDQKQSLQRVKALHAAAEDYAASHGGRLDAGWETAVQQVLKDNPLGKFTPAIQPTQAQSAYPGGSRIIKVH
jgi:muramidase (phage lysozyme)